MKKLIVSSFVGVGLLTMVGCGTYPNMGQSSNLNPLGIVGPLNPPIFNGEAVTLAFSQLLQFGTLDVVGPGINFHAAKNMPPGYIAQAIVPLTSDEATLVTHAFIANTVYGMRNDHSSWDVTLVPALGWTVTLHVAYPPSTLNVTVVTNTTTTSPITIPSVTTTNVTQVLSK